MNIKLKAYYESCSRRRNGPYAISRYNNLTLYVSYLQTAA